jgi:serine protease Do
MTSGIVSATDRVITTDESTSINMFQIDAAVNSGNSGGPLYNTSGQVVGVVTAKYSEPAWKASASRSRSTTPSISPMSLLRTATLPANLYGRRRPDRLGQRSNITTWCRGAYVYSIESGSCSEIAGLKVGDIITVLDGVEIAPPRTSRPRSNSIPQQIRSK